MENEFKLKMPVGNETVDIKTPTDTTTLTNEQIEEKRLADEKILADAETERLRLLEVEKNKSKDTNLESFIEGQLVELDGVQLTIDKDGNAIDTTGKIVKTVDELKEYVKPREETNTDYIKEIQTKTNLVITDDKGQPITYENTVEGISKYTEDVFSNGKNLGKQEYEQEILNQFPIIKDVITHLKLNGSLEGFTNKVDYSKISLDDKDEDQWLGIYIAAQTKRGISEEEARSTARYFKEDGKLKEVAQKSLTFLSESQVKDADNIQRQLQEQEQSEIEENTKYWNTAQNLILTNGKIKLGEEELIIPKVMRVKENNTIVTKTPTDFWNYINKPQRFVINGKTVEATQHQIDLAKEQENRNVNDDVYEALVRFLKQDKSQIIKAQIKTATTKEIIKLTNKTTSIGAGDQGSGVKKLILPVAKTN